MIISSREFRDQQKKYFDLADQNEQVIVQRGKDKAYVIVPLNDADRLSVNDQLEISSKDRIIYRVYLPYSGTGVSHLDPPVHLRLR